MQTSFGVLLDTNKLHFMLQTQTSGVFLYVIIIDNIERKKHI